MLTRAAAAALTLGLVVACGGGDGPTNPDPAPSSLIVNTPLEPPPRFIPATGRIAVGGTVTWVNRSPDPLGVHDVTSNTGEWQKAELQPGERFSFTFEEAGSYGYRCDIHPGMTGVISVE
jgi:plastocyanin